MKNLLNSKLITTVYNDSLKCGWEEFFGWWEEFQISREIYNPVSDLLSMQDFYIEKEYNSNFHEND